jgi:hypothetical protein
MKRVLLLGSILIAVLVGFFALACSREDASDPLAEVKDIKVARPSSTDQGTWTMTRAHRPEDRTTPSGRTAASTISPCVTRMPCTP